MRMSRNPTNIPGRSNCDYQSGDNLSPSVRFYSGTSGSYQMPFPGQRQSSPYQPTGLSREDYLVKNQQSQTMSWSYQSMSSWSCQAPSEHSWSPQGMHSHTHNLHQITVLQWRIVIIFVMNVDKNVQMEHCLRLTSSTFTHPDLHHICPQLRQEVVMI